MIELLVVVRRNTDLEKLDDKLGTQRSHSYHYADMVDVIYYVQESEIENLGDRLDNLSEVEVYNFGDTYITEGT